MLFGKIIPVQQNNQWEFYTIRVARNSNGEKEVSCARLQEKCNSIGCISRTAATKSTAWNIMALEDYHLLIIEKNGYYGFLDVDTGDEPLGVSLTDIYMETREGNINYYFIGKNGSTYNVIEQLENYGYTKRVK